jgi:hypothetical protein
LENKKYLGDLETNLLAAIPGLFGFLIGLIWVLFYKKTFTGKPLEVLALFFMMVSWGAMGLVYVIRKESPGFFFKVKGIFGVLTGLAVMIFCWGFAILVVLMYFWGMYK